MILRGHHLICILGFRGRGYSEKYVANMSQLVEKLRSSPKSLVEIVDTPDDICLPCPFLVEAGCHQKGPESEERIRSRDHAVMEKLGLLPGEAMAWSAILERIRTLISPGDLGTICQECEWLPLGYCVEGVRRLRRRH